MGRQRDAVARREKAVKAREARSAESAIAESQARKEAASAMVHTGKSAVEAQRTASLARERVEVLERVSGAVA